MTTLLGNGTILDGSGGEPFAGDVLLEQGVIAAVGRFEPPAGAAVVDCSGLVVAPGFIDAHSHSDLQVIEGRPEKSLQGVTAEVVGNCGFSAYPIGGRAQAVREFANGIFCGEGAWGWDSARDYLDAVAAGAGRVHVVSLVGHGTLRIAVAGTRCGPLDAGEAAEMESTLDRLLAEGAAGFSTGLMYAPGDSAPFEELERLCRVVARRGRIYTSHIRTYFSGLVEAVEEQLELARRTGCRLQISHLQAAGAANWKFQEPAIERIEAARAQGIDVAFDCYPYVAGSTVLTQILPQSALDGGIDAMVARLRDPAARRRIAEQMLPALAWRWTDVYISAVASPANQGAVGKNLAQLAEIRSMPPVDVIFTLLVEEHGAVNMLCFNQSEENLRATLTHPLSIVISDGFYVRGRPHPRLHGTFPHLLGEFCRQRGWLSLPEAVRKMTSAPAERFGMAKRGRLAPGFSADVTVFDAAAIGSDATYDDPERPPRGVRHVFRSGAPVTAGAA